MNLKLPIVDYCTVASESWSSVRRKIKDKRVESSIENDNGGQRKYFIHLKTTSGKAKKINDCLERIKKIL